MRENASWLCRRIGIRCHLRLSLILGLVALTLLDLCWFSTVRASDAIVIPVELKGGNNFTTVRIGDVDLKTIIDTGGWLDIAIAPEIVAKLHVRFTGTVTEATNGGGSTSQGLREFRIPAMQLGGVTFRNILGHERPQAANGDIDRRPPFDATLGRGFLERYTVVVDYPHQRFKLYPALRARKVCGAATAAILPTQDGFMFSSIQTDNGPMNLGWDTGANYSFVQESLAKARQLKITDVFYSTHRFALGQFDAGAMRLVAIDLSGLPTLDGLIGYNFFEKHRVCFDYVRRTVSVRQ
jgi:Aspartyl protease